MSTKNYRVKVAACFVTVPGVGGVLLYREAPVPDSVENLDELEAAGFIEQAAVEDVGGHPSDLPDDFTPPAFPGGAEPSNVDDVDGAGPIPAKSAAKADWVAYAVTQGATQSEAEVSTKEDLIAAYGGA